MASNSYILPKVMNALAAAITAQAFAWVGSVNAGFKRGELDADGNINPDSQALPKIVCGATDAQAITPQSATFTVRAEVKVFHAADDTDQADHLEQSGQVSDYLYGDALQADLNDTADFTAQHINLTGQRCGIEGRCWVSTFELEISAAGSAISLA